MRSLSRNQLRAHIPGAQLYSASQVCRSGHRGGSACWGECMPRYNACRRQRSTSRHACSPRRQRMLVAGPQRMSVPPPWPEARASERLDRPSSSIGLHYICVAPIATSMSMASTSIPTSSARRLNPRVLSHGLARLLWTAQGVSASAKGAKLSKVKNTSLRKSTASTSNMRKEANRAMRDLSLCAIAIANRSDFKSQIPKSLRKKSQSQIATRSHTGCEFQSETQHKISKTVRAVLQNTTKISESQLGIAT